MSFRVKWAELKDCSAEAVVDDWESHASVLLCYRTAGAADAVEPCLGLGPCRGRFRLE